MSRGREGYLFVGDVMPVCGFGFPHICPDGEAVLHPARRTCSPGIWNLPGMPQRIKKKSSLAAASGGDADIRLGLFITNFKSEEQYFTVD